MNQNNNNYYNDIFRGIKIAKVFVVDDDRTIVYLFEKLLSATGHEVIAKAYDGEQAIKIYRNFQDFPDIVLMDHRMPKKDGLTTIKEILTINPKCKIVFISADFSAIDQALEIGVSHYLVKPISIMDLSIIINQVISGSRKEESTVVKSQTFCS
ncbi:MAG: response regulator transcription factor [Candidatus Hodarchaeota archaeon]